MGLKALWPHFLMVALPSPLSVAPSGLFSFFSGTVGWFGVVSSSLTSALPSPLSVAPNGLVGLTGLVGVTGLSGFGVS